MPRLALPLAVGLLFVLTSSSRPAEEKLDPRDLLAKAIKAAGGADQLKKYRAQTARFTGAFHNDGQTVSYTGKVAMQLPTSIRVEVEATTREGKFKMVNVIAGDKGWVAIRGKTLDKDKDELANAKEELYRGWLERLVPLGGKEFTLTIGGEAMVGGKPALGLKVSAKGHRDVTYFFDKASFLLVKSETKVPGENKKDVKQETFYSKHKAVQGIQVPMKMQIRRDGQLFSEQELSDVKLLEKLDAKTFVKP